MDRSVGPEPGRVTARAHRTLRTHLPAPDWRWLGLRLSCRYCGQRYPCPPRRLALRHLEPARLKEDRW